MSSPHAPTASSCQPLWRLYWTRTTNDVPAAHRLGADTAPKSAHAMLPTNARLASLEPMASSRHDRIRRDRIRRVTGSVGVSRVDRQTDVHQTVDWCTPSLVTNPSRAASLTKPTFG